MNQHFDHTAAATGHDQAAAAATMAPPFSAEARARFQQVLALTASVTYTVNGVPATEAVSDVADYLFSLAQTGDAATFHYVTGIALAPGRLGADDYTLLKAAIDYMLNYETQTLQQTAAVTLAAVGELIVDGGIDAMLTILSPKAITGNVVIGALSGAASEFFDPPADASSALSTKASLLFGAPFAADSTITITGGELSLNHVGMLGGYAALNLAGVGVAGTRAEFFSGATTLSANGQSALDGMPGSITVSDGLSIAQRALLDGLDPGVAISAPITDTAAHLGTYNAATFLWEINPAVGAGATVNVTDSSVPAGLLHALLFATGWSGHVNAPGATAITGTMYDIDLAMGYADISWPPSAALSLTETVLDAYAAAEFKADHPSLQLDGSGVKTLDGDLGQLTTLLGQQAYFNFSGHQAVNVRGIALAELAGAKAMIATYSDGAVTADLVDVAANLLSQHPTTHVWSVNAAIGAGFGVRVDWEANANMAIGAVLALVKAVGATGEVDLNLVQRFSGSLAEVQLLRASGAVLNLYGLTVTDAAVTASTLIALRATTEYSVQTSAGKITGTTAEINQLFFTADYAVLSSTVDIALTTPLRVVDLASLRASYADVTSGKVTGMLRDSVQNLTGHLADSTGGYVVLDSVAVVTAHGSIVAGAKQVELADTIANLAGHTTAGGAASYTVVDTLANLTAHNGSVTGGAASIVAADTVAHLTGHTQDGGATAYAVIDSLSNINGAGDSLLGAALSVKLTDTIANVESLAAWGVDKAPLDARSLTLMSGHIDKLVDVLQNVALSFSGSEEVAVIDGGTAAQLNVLDAATTGVVSSTVSGTGGELATLTGTGNMYQVTVTDSASISQLTAIDAATAGNISYTSVTDTASHLASLKNGVWTASSYVHDGTTVLVLGDMDEGALAAVDAANGSGNVILVAPAATDFVIATSDVQHYQIPSASVYNIIDVEGTQSYELYAPFSGLHGGILNLSGTDGQNTFAFHGYVPDGVDGAHLTLTLSGTTAIFSDAQTHVQVAVIGMSLDYAPIQNVVFEDGSGFNLTLVGTSNPVLTMTPFQIG